LIHDADLEDDKFHRVEGFGVERVFKGWAKKGLTDHDWCLGDNLDDIHSLLSLDLFGRPLH